MEKLTIANMLSGAILKDETSSASILIAGDLYPGGRSEQFIIDYKKTGIWNDVHGQINDHDLAIVNLESPLTMSKSPIVKSGPHLRANPLCAESIRSAGFNVVTLANNHIMDMGKEGLSDTLRACREAGLQTVGAGNTLLNASTPLYVAVKNQRIAIVSLAEQEFSAATNSSAGAWPLDVLDNHTQIQEAKAKSDFVLVILHGGNEYYPLPSPRMAKTCRFLVDMGANAVVCHHIHVPSGIEIYRDAPIVYSTGNFLFDNKEITLEEWFTGYMVSLSIGVSSVVSLRLIPYRQCSGKVGIRLMDQDDTKRFFLEIARLSDIISNKQLLLQQWTKFCETKRKEYLSFMFSLSRIERLFLKIFNLWPYWRARNKSLPALLNLFRCESHRDVCIELLNSETETITHNTKRETNT